MPHNHLYGWTGTLAAHIEAQCHVGESGHHEEVLVDQVEKHHHDADKAPHEKDCCDPEDCSDQCRTCHISSSGFISVIEHRDQQRSPALKEISANDLDTPDSIAARPDTPPPKV